MPNCGSRGEVPSKRRSRSKDRKRDRAFSLRGLKGEERKAMQAKRDAHRAYEAVKKSQAQEAVERQAESFETQTLRRQINRDLDNGLSVHVTDHAGRAYQLLGWGKRGKALGRYSARALKSKGKFLLSIKDIRFVDSEETALRKAINRDKAGAARDQERIERAIDEMNAESVEMEFEELLYHEASIGEKRYEHEGSGWTKWTARKSRFMAARHALSGAYDKLGRNLRTEWGVRVDSALAMSTKMEGRIKTDLRDEVFSHMSSGEQKDSRRILSWMLDGSREAQIKEEFGRAPTAKETEAALKLKSYMGMKKGRGLHGFFGIEGFLGNYLPHLRIARTNLRDIDKLKDSGEWGSLPENHRLKKWDVDYNEGGFVYANSDGSVPGQLENFHRLERDHKMSSWEDDIFVVLDRYIDMGLRKRYVSPILEDMKKDYGVDYIRSHEDGLFHFKDIKNIGEFEREVLFEHVRSLLGYKTNMENGISQSIINHLNAWNKMLPEGSRGRIKNPGKYTLGSMAQVWTRLINWGALGLRPASALKQLTGMPIVAGEVGVPAFIRGTAYVLKNPMRAMREAEAAGVFQREFLPAQQKQIHIEQKKFLKLIDMEKMDKGMLGMFEMMDKSVRAVGYHAGRAKAKSKMGRLHLDTIRDEAAKNRLIRLRDAKDWEGLAEEYGKFVSADTQFLYGRGDNPIAFRSAYGRLAGQFMTWGMYAGGKFVHWGTRGTAEAFRKGGAKSLAKQLAKNGMAHMAPMLFSIYLMQAILEKTAGADATPWFYLFEVPQAMGPAARVPWGVAQVINDAGRMGVSSLLGSEKWSERARDDFGRDLSTFTRDLGVNVPGFMWGRDMARTVEWLRKGDNAEAARRFFGLRGIEE